MRLFEIALVALVPLAALMVGVLLKPPSSRWLEAGAIVVVAAIATTGTSVLTSEGYLRFIRRFVTEQLAQVTEMALLRTAGVGQLYTKQMLSSTEGTMDVDTIWIVCEDLGDDIRNDGPFLKVIKQNVQRGVTYVYITPADRGDTQSQVRVLCQKLRLEKDDKRVRLVKLPPDDWNKLPYTQGNVTIYDPLATRTSTTGYFWYPGGDGDAFGRLGDTVAAGWADKIAPTIEPFLNGSSEEEQLMPHPRLSSDAPPRIRDDSIGEDPAVEGSDA